MLVPLLQVQIQILFPLSENSGDTVDNIIITNYGDNIMQTDNSDLSEPQCN